MTFLQLADVARHEKRLAGYWRQRGGTSTTGTSRHDLRVTDGVRMKGADSGRLTRARALIGHSSFGTHDGHANGHVREYQGGRGNAQKPGDEISHPDTPSSDERRGANLAATKPREPHKCNIFARTTLGATVRDYRVAANIFALIHLHLAWLGVSARAKRKIKLSECKTRVSSSALQARAIVLRIA
jgi:hypothetical protein